MLQAEPEYRLKPEDIGQYHVRNDKGTMVPLGAFVATERIFGPESTIRHNMFRGVELTVDGAPGYSSGQVIAALESVANEVLPKGIGYEWSGMTFQERKASGGAAAIFDLSFLMVFLILAAM